MYNVLFHVILFAYLLASLLFWLYMGLGAGLMLVTQARERNPIALYVLLLFALPPYEADLPGFGLVNYFVEMDLEKMRASVPYLRKLQV